MKCDVMHHFDLHVGLVVDLCDVVIVEGLFVVVVVVISVEGFVVVFVVIVVGSVVIVVTIVCVAVVATYGEELLCCDVTFDDVIMGLAVVTAVECIK